MTKREKELEAEVQRLLDEVKRWKSAHADVKQRAALLRERPDLPVDRLPAAASYEKRIANLQRENDALRVIAATIRCPYGQRLPSGVCNLGYPGCGCMDDLMIAEERYPHDDTGRALKRLKTRCEQAEVNALRYETWRAYWFDDEGGDDLNEAMNAAKTPNDMDAVFDTFAKAKLLMRGMP